MSHRSLGLNEEQSPFEVAGQGERYGEPALIRPRLGQGSFRVAVVDAYGRRCSVTGEKTLPVLEAAHIRPFASGGPNEISNGMLLRQDIHTLFDRGYVTVTPSHRFKVSRRIHEDFDNGRHYYAFHGQEVNVPRNEIWKPDTNALEWHNNSVFLEPDLKVVE